MVNMFWQAGFSHVRGGARRFPRLSETVSADEAFSSESPCLAGLLAFGLGGLAVRLVLFQQQLTQGLQVASQDAQGHVTLIATLAAITAAFRPLPFCKAPITDSTPG